MDDKKLTSEVKELSDEDELSISRARNIRMKLRHLPAAAEKLWREYRRDAKLHAREGAVGFALGLCAYLLGSCSLLFETFPLGLALLCASPKKIVWILSGLAVAALGMNPPSYIYFFAYLTAVTVRILSRLLIDTPQHESKTIRQKAHAAFSESIYLRMATSAACAFIVGIYSIISQDFEYYQLFGVIFSIICTPLATFVYAGCFEESGSDVHLRELSVSLLLISLSFALRDMYIIGISAGAFFTYFVTLYVCRQSGMVRGALMGLALGIAYSPIYAPMFALSGITVGVLWDISAFGALVAGGTAGMLWGFYIEGLSAMSRLMPAIMLASVCYMGAKKLSVFPAAKDLLFSGKYCSDMNDAAMDREGRESAYKKLAALSDSFGSLSELFYDLSDRLNRPQTAELRIMCDKVYDKYCTHCHNKSVCWDREYPASKNMLTSISEKLRASGFADTADIPEYMKARCVALPGIIGEINRESAKLFRKCRHTDKTEVFAMDYKAVSDLLTEASEANKRDYVPDKELSERLALTLAEYGFGNGGVSVYGERQKRIIARGFDISKGNIGMIDLKKSVEKTCSFPVSDPILEIKDNMITLKMTSARRILGKSSVLVSGTGAEKCGDSAICFESSDDRYYALICDGMGSGSEAALTSSLCTTFLQKMLSVGNGVDGAIKMLNSFVKSKSVECSSTLDLMELDLVSGRGRIVKCGAAPSFVRRGKNVFKLTAATLPLGILESIDAERLSFDVLSGDFIIMVSDGAMLSEDDDWLTSLLSDEWENDMNLMSKKIISRSRQKGSRDDISVVITKIM